MAHQLPGEGLAEHTLHPFHKLRRRSIFPESERVDRIPFDREQERFRTEQGEGVMTESISRTSRFRWLLVLLVSLVGCDQASKQYAVTHWENQPPQSYCFDTFRVTFAKNPGAFLGLFGAQADGVRQLILVIGNGLLLAALAVAILMMPKIDRWSYLAWALVFVGGIGNLIDRIRINAVIDFLNLGIGPLRTGIFNVADMAITAGFFMIVPQILRGEPKEAAASSVSADTTPGTPS